jgi:7-keto-8-aminopelargonate synthetase-like enzyme
VLHLRRLQEIVADHLGMLCPSPIIPIVVGDAKTALALADTLLKSGFHVPAIRPPTVPEGTSRLRLSLSAEHRIEDVKRLLHILTEHRARFQQPLPERMGSIQGASKL